MLQSPRPIPIPERVTLRGEVLAPLPSCLLFSTGRRCGWIYKRDLLALGCDRTCAVAVTIPPGAARRAGLID